MDNIVSLDPFNFHQYSTHPAQYTHAALTNEQQLNQVELGVQRTISMRVGARQRLVSAERPARYPGGANAQRGTRLSSWAVSGVSLYLVR